MSVLYYRSDVSGLLCVLEVDCVLYYRSDVSGLLCVLEVDCECFVL